MNEHHQAGSPSGTSSQANTEPISPAERERRKALHRLLAREARRELKRALREKLEREEQPGVGQPTGGPLGDTRDSGF